MVVSEYLSSLYHRKTFELTVNAAADFCREVLAKYKEENSVQDLKPGLVGRGMSGALILPALGFNLDWPFAIVRKMEDASHAYRMIEGDLNFNHYIFIDDFVCSGNTFAAVNDELLRCFCDGKSPNPIGCVFYRSATSGLNFKSRILNHIANDYKDEIKQHNSSNIDIIKKMIIKKFSLDPYRIYSNMDIEETTFTVQEKIEAKDNGCF